MELGTPKRIFEIIRMFFFKKKKKALYPSVYSEWLREFKRMDTALISEEDAALLKSGGLTDSKYCIDNFKRELTLFLEKQLERYFHEMDKAVQQYVEENDCEYLILMIRRYHLEYQRLYFFAELSFLEQSFRDDLKSTLKSKLYQYDNELIAYFNEIAEISDSMSEVSTNIKRLIEV